MVALRPAMVLVAGLAVISTAFSATQGTEPSSAATQDGTSAAKGYTHHPAGSGEAPSTAQFAQAEPSKSASEDEAFAKPPWAGDDVTGDKRYYNARLVEKPFTTW